MWEASCTAEIQVCTCGKPFAPGKCSSAKCKSVFPHCKMAFPRCNSVFPRCNCAFPPRNALPTTARVYFLTAIPYFPAAIVHFLHAKGFPRLQRCISFTQCPSHNCNCAFPHRNSVFPGCNCAFPGCNSVFPGCNCAFPPRKGLPPATGVHFHHTRPFPPLHRRAFPCHNLPFPAQRNLFLDCARPFTEGMDSFLRQRDAFRIYVEVLDRSGHASAQR